MSQENKEVGRKKRSAIFEAMLSAFLEKKGVDCGGRDKLLERLDLVKLNKLLYLMCLEDCKLSEQGVARYESGVLLPMFRFTAYDKGPVDGDVYASIKENLGALFEYDDDAKRLRERGEQELTLSPEVKEAIDIACQRLIDNGLFDLSTQELVNLTHDDLCAWRACYYDPSQEAYADGGMSRFLLEHNITSEMRAYRATLYRRKRRQACGVIA